MADGRSMSADPRTRRKERDVVCDFLDLRILGATAMSAGREPF